MRVATHTCFRQAAENCRLAACAPQPLAGPNYSAQPAAHNPLGILELKVPRDQPPLRKRQRSVAARSPYFASAAELVKKAVSGLVALAVWRDSTRPIS